MDVNLCHAVDGTEKIILGSKDDNGSETSNPAG